MMHRYLARERGVPAAHSFVVFLKKPMCHAGFLQRKRLRHDFGVDARSGM
jgi:hypothetical protein